MKRTFSILLVASGMLFAIAAVANAQGRGHRGHSHFSSRARIGSYSNYGSAHRRGPTVGYGRSAYGPYISRSYARVSPGPRFGSRSYSQRAYGNYRVRSTGFGRSCR
ncbi:hypothetical protein Fuma_04728 [Fuerstiella marisgermanici]|uniref:Uncharacterized protein n=1 Tax=Fuerstiella marisgermanici TaxID=1891926 RepID=A0A1P8WLZ5_9PLAN|nr:hypothetical protein Fuma_04728 [Fuerstiella marisgermanici]